MYKSNYSIYVYITNIMLYACIITMFCISTFGTLTNSMFYLFINLNQLYSLLPVNSFTMAKQICLAPTN